MKAKRAMPPRRRRQGARSGYLLARIEDKKISTIVGLFTTMGRLKDRLRKLPRKYSYMVFRVPLDTILTKGTTLKDRIHDFKYHYFGTFAELVVEAKKGKISREYRRKVVFWPK